MSPEMISALGLYGPIVVLFFLVGLGFKYAVNWLDARGVATATGMQKEIDELRGRVEKLEDGQTAARIILLDAYALSTEAPVRTKIRDALDKLH